MGLGADALGRVHDGGSFVTSIPTAVPGATHGIAHQAVQVQPDAAATAALAGQVAAGELTVRVAEILPLERFRDAYTRLNRGGLYGKALLIP